MKKNKIFILAITVLFAFATSCKSAKKGCGLTSDAQKIDNIKTHQQQNAFYTK